MEPVKHIIIPVFLNNLGCPASGRCVFCDQAASGGTPCSPDSIESYLKNFISGLEKENISKNEYSYEIAFYGGTFTALRRQVQASFFEAGRSALKAAGESRGGRFEGFRISTRPDFIDIETLSFLKENTVKTIEIGIESFDDGVLEKAGRGYSSAAAIASCDLIKKTGFKLSLHLMCGLEGQTRDVFLRDCSSLASAGPDYARIHPLCVMAGSRLGEFYKAGGFVPRPDSELIEETAYAMSFFELNNIKIIRAGILENDKFRKEVLAGPAFPNLREIAESLIHSTVYDFIRAKFQRPSKIIIETGREKTLNYLVGYKKENIKKNNDLLLEFKNKILYNNAKDAMPYILISAENNELTYVLTRPDVLKQYINKF
ncbi:MAG: Oxygen-independent coproporphyrinogen-III oxidase 1 [bacterium ADurb.Bin243]|nr:MAG: Oxygen-independent coproporphyrinogen-III oxidase 1 [bacterium ADurb.Bin243]